MSHHRGRCQRLPIKLPSPSVCFPLFLFVAHPPLTLSLTRIEPLHCSFLFDLQMSLIAALPSISRSILPQTNPGQSSLRRHVHKMSTSYPTSRTTRVDLRVTGGLPARGSVAGAASLVFSVFSAFPLLLPQADLALLKPSFEPLLKPSFQPRTCRQRIAGGRGSSSIQATSGRSERSQGVREVPQPLSLGS